MRYLLDTHALLWSLTDPSRLGEEARATISDPTSTLFVSAVSAWELSTKQRLGKLPQAEVLVHGFARHLDRLGAERLPILEEHALLAGRMQWAHRNPFDRMLAAQAMLESMTLLTGDAAFEGLSGLALRW